VRQVVCYDRFVGECAYRQLSELYRALRLYVNHFQPSMKLQAKQRLGKKVRFVYDPAKTPLQRVLLSGVLPAQKQQELTEVVHTLDPIRLFQQLEQLQQAVFRCAVGCSPCVSSIPSAPIHVFSVDDCIAKSRSGENASWTGSARTKIPLRGVGAVTSWVVANPERSSGDIFRELQRLSPGRYQPLQNRTLFASHAQDPILPVSETFEEQWQDEVIRGPCPLYGLRCCTRSDCCPRPCGVSCC
jgi:hypothetical protein